MQRSFKSICHRHPSIGKFFFKFSHPFFNFSKYWNKFQLNSSIFFHSNFIIDLRRLAIKWTRSFQSCLPNAKSETSSNKLPYSVILLKKINKGADPEAIIWQETCGRERVLVTVIQRTGKSLTQWHTRIPTFFSGIERNWFLFHCYEFWMSRKPFCRLKRLRRGVIACSEGE